MDARTSTLALSQELTRVNKAKVDVGQSPPLDLVSAQAEVAANEEQLIIAQTLVHQAEDRLRLLIFDPTDLSIWNQKIEPIDSPPIAQVTPRRRRGRDGERSAAGPISRGRRRTSRTPTPP